MTDMDPGTFRDYVADQVGRYLGSDGEDGAIWNGLPCVILTSVGARSGETRLTPIIRVPVPDSDDWIAVGSMGGAPKSPSWVFNLRADPTAVTLQDGATKRTYVATETAGDERAELWDIAVGVYPEYAEYQERTTRVIPVFRLTPTD